jgi:fatty acid desaturase
MPGLLRAALADWVVIAMCWTVMALGPAWLLPLMVLLVAGRLHALGVVLHDDCHMPAARHPARSSQAARLKLLEVLAGYPITTTLLAMRYHHLRDHRHNGTALDPYFRTGASTHAWPAWWARARGLIVPLAWMLRPCAAMLSLAVPRLRNGYARVFLGDRSGRHPGSEPELLACLRADLGQALFFIPVLVLAWLHPLAFGLGYLLPLLLAGLCNAHRVVAEHLHDQTAGTRLSREALTATTVTHDVGPLGQVLLYPRHIGLHLVHHLHPTAGMHSLPALQAWYRTHHLP